MKVAAILALMLTLTACGGQGLRSGNTAETVTETVTRETSRGPVSCVVLFDGTSLQREAVEVECDWEALNG